MSENLLIVPVEFKDKLEEKEQAVINKLRANYELIYSDDKSLESLVCK